MSFGKEGKLSPRFIVSVVVLQHVGEKLGDSILLLGLAIMHLEFQVLMLKEDYSNVDEAIWEVETVHDMCAKVGVDPLASNKGFWAELLAIADCASEEHSLTLPAPLCSKTVEEVWSLALETYMEDKTTFYLDNPQRCHTNSGQSKKEKELTGEQMLYVPKRLKSQLTCFALPCCNKPMAHVNSKWTEKNNRYFDGISTPKCVLKSKCWRLGTSYPKLMMLSRFRIF
ncbi:hypothetical protein KY290_021872 [Solanum tuberosum]|uniref:Uncharacterized protein n=1 Tax=Solanum tuberosum TaxID=4113 RepID=A0ABQ7V4C6_SOLTU|nr:hypothetical protein KY289_021035 [Solanum tuberosum]KAH0758379.1 hypothetical protein KY290_021872 [Solanum tuberosum]